MSFCVFPTLECYTYAISKTFEYIPKLSFCLFHRYATINFELRNFFPNQIFSKSTDNDRNITFISCKDYKDIAKITNILLQVNFLALYMQLISCFGMRKCAIQCYFYVINKRLYKKLTFFALFDYNIFVMSSDREKTNSAMLPPIGASYYHFPLLSANYLEGDQKTHSLI